MPVIYDGKKITPAPFFNVEREFNKTEDGTIIGNSYSITIVGTCLPDRGSPNSTGDFSTTSDLADESIPDNERLKSLLRKQTALRDLFADEGKTLEIQPWDDSTPWKCNPRSIKLSIPDDKWVTHFDYTITMEADRVYFTGAADGEDDFTEFVETASESWAVETLEDAPASLDYPRTYRLTHTVSAKGKRFFNDSEELVSNAWEQARLYVLPRLGFDASFVASNAVLDLPSEFTGYNHFRGETIDELGGTYSVTESWVLSSDSALEEFNVSHRYSIDDGLNYVTVEGQVKGLEERTTDMSLTTGKYDNANTLFASLTGNFLNRAQTYSTITLNVDPISTNIAKNPSLGTINYSYEYSDRPSNQISNALSEVISIGFGNQSDSFASVFVLGRAAGPVLQALNTPTAKTKRLNIEAVMPQTNVVSPTLPDVTSIVSAATPTGSQVFKSSDTEDMRAGRFYSRSIEWTYE